MPVSLYPLRFEPIFKTNLWGGTRLRPWLGQPASTDATGEAWVISDVDGSASHVANGPLAGATLRELMIEYGCALLGDVKPIDGRFPLLLKYIDAMQELSVQVHPTDEQARAKDPRAAGKTEAWVVLDTDPATSRIYAGFQPGMTEAKFRSAMRSGSVPGTLHQFVPKPGDCLFLTAGTVHAIGTDMMLFEVQQTSDITYRLYDWDRVDAKTGMPRVMHIDDGLACSDFSKGPCLPVVPERDGEIEHLVACNYFSLDRVTVTRPFPIGRTNGRCRIVVVEAGQGTLDGETIRTGDAFLIPASVHVETILPEGPLSLLCCTPGQGAPC